MKLNDLIQLYNFRYIYLDDQKKEVRDIKVIRVYITSSRDDYVEFGIGDYGNVGFNGIVFNVFDTSFLSKEIIDITVDNEQLEIWIQE